MPAVTRTVETALQRGCAAWHLHLDKFSFEPQCGADAKTRALEAVVQTYIRQRDPLQAVLRARLQWLDTLQRQHVNRYGEVTLTLESRLLLHLGRASVLENVGLYCERTTGLPLIPGAALKGVVSTWACWAAHQRADLSFGEFTHSSVQRRHFTGEEARLARWILGDDSVTGSEHAGEVVFVGGFPTVLPSLGLDIVNPHHDPEGRDIEPQPNTFLCLEPGPPWRFVFFLRPGAPEPDRLLATTRRWLTEALTQVGIGAKTAAGYGRFRLPEGAGRSSKAGVLAPSEAAPETGSEPGQSGPCPQPPAGPQAALVADYPNDATFRNRVLNKLDPGRLEQLETEVKILKKPENAAWVEKLRQVLASQPYKDIRKRLREKEWFPQHWLPPR